MQKIPKVASSGAPASRCLRCPGLIRLPVALAARGGGRHEQPQERFGQHPVRHQRDVRLAHAAKEALQVLTQIIIDPRHFAEVCRRGPVAIHFLTDSHWTDI